MDVLHKEASSGYRCDGREERKYCGFTYPGPGQQRVAWHCRL